MLKKITIYSVVTSFSLAILFSCGINDASHQPMQTSNTIAIDHDDNKDSILIKAAHVVPTENQYQALKDEFIAFIHFGPNTFTRMEWGNGMEDPKVFDLKELDTDQWCEAMKSAGMTKVILTVKHHDGFCLWQTRYTKHGIMSTNFKNGKGDILKELAESCKKYGLKLGIYLSPADLYQIENKNGLYGNLSEYTERVIPTPVKGRPFNNKTTFTFKVDDYNAYFLNQLFELLTEYGRIDEVWFDGAHPKRKGNQQYNYIAWKELISTLAPNAVVFGKEDIRWCGNEAGKTRDTEWNVIPYQDNPNTLNHFADLTAKDLGSRTQLQKGKFLHYQFAETNTSIREGWFYRDDTYQKVRSVNDVFDIYERAIGGNSTFLLNIPPNRSGKFSDEDVQVLKEVGQRIKNTYSKNLLLNSNLDKRLMDGNDRTVMTFDSANNAIEIKTEHPITINRFELKEAIKDYGERIEEHELLAFINGQWQMVSQGTNVGYKRILRFPKVTSDRFKLVLKQWRYKPYLNHIAAYYYKSGPPELDIKRNLDGLVHISPKQNDFNWKPHGENATKNLSDGIEIKFTTDGSEPNKQSTTFTKPFYFEKGLIKARAYTETDQGLINEATIGLIKKEWQSISNSSTKEHQPELAFDANTNTFWQSKEQRLPISFTIDLGSQQSFSGFTLTPQTIKAEGMPESGLIQISENGKQWQTVKSFKFGNMINDPTPRTVHFNPVNSRFIRIQVTDIAGGYRYLTIAEIDLLP